MRSSVDLEDATTEEEVWTFEAMCDCTPVVLPCPRDLKQILYNESSHYKDSVCDKNERETYLLFRAETGVTVCPAVLSPE
ncbi:hypothetical protein FKM82_022042 [Ascaphus truei]